MQTLSLHGHAMPRLGFGTWQLTGRDCVEGVKDALSLGYRHIDTAAMYGNEAEVAEGIRDAPIGRDDLFLTTKIWWEDLAPDALDQAMDTCLANLDTDHVDLALVHWPAGDVPLADTMRALASVRDDGRATRIGVSNFTPTQAKTAIDHAPISNIQVEYHPFLSQRPLLDLCEAHDLVLTAYSPLARGRVVDDPTLSRIAEAHDVAPTAVALRWLMDQGPVAAIPKAAKSAHRKANLAALTLTLTDEERHAIASLPKDDRLIDPSFAPDWEARPAPPTA